VTDKVQILAVAASIGLLLVVLELVRRRRLVEEYSLLWVFAALALIGVSLRRSVLDIVARWLDVHYPPAVLVLLLILIVFIASLCFSVILSSQQRQIDRLIDETSVLSAELRDLRQAQSIGLDTSSSGAMPSQPARPADEDLVRSSRASTSR
jgi:hypothetical protein